MNWHQALSTLKESSTVCTNLCLYLVEIICLIEYPLQVVRTTILCLPLMLTFVFWQTCLFSSLENDDISEGIEATGGQWARDGEGALVEHCFEAGETAADRKWGDVKIIRWRPFADANGLTNNCFRNQAIRKSATRSVHWYFTEEYKNVVSKSG